MTVPAQDGPLRHDAWEELAAGWALDALEPADEKAFARHLPTCARCQQDVAAHLVVAEHLSTSLAGADEPAPEMPLLLGREAGLVGGPRGRFMRTRRDVARSRWLTTVAAAVVALVIGGVTGAVINSGGGPAKATTTYALNESAALEALSTGMLTRLAAPDGSASATVAVSHGNAYLVANGLPSVLSHGQQYVVWAAGSDGVMHAVTGFDGGAKPAMVALGSTSEDVRTFGVTREKVGKLPVKPGALVLAAP
jgi:hypothetical protein